jgi:hypothetical protein
MGSISLTNRVKWGSDRGEESSPLIGSNVVQGVFWDPSPLGGQTWSALAGGRRRWQVTCCPPHRPVRRNESPELPASDTISKVPVCARHPCLLYITYLRNKIPNKYKFTTINSLYIYIYIYNTIISTYHCKLSCWGWQCTPACIINGHPNVQPPINIIAVSQYVLGDRIIHVVRILACTAVQQLAVTTRIASCLYSVQSDTQQGSTPILNKPHTMNTHCPTA